MKNADFYQSDWIDDDDDDDGWFCACVCVSFSTVYRLNQNRK